MRRARRSGSIGLRDRHDRGHDDQQYGHRDLFGSGGPITIPSNKIDLRVDEILDVTVAGADGGDVNVARGANNQVLAFTVTNPGNGGEGFRRAFVNAIGGDAFDPGTTSMALDSNANGIYDAGVDTVYTPGGNDPVLAPDASIRIFVLSTIPGGATDTQRGQTDQTADALTGTGAPGTVFVNSGTGGGDAVVGASRADGRGQGCYRVSASTLSFVKSVDCCSYSTTATPAHSGLHRCGRRPKLGQPTRRQRLRLARKARGAKRRGIGRGRRGERRHGADVARLGRRAVAADRQQLEPRLVAAPQPAARTLALLGHPLASDRFGVDDLRGWSNLLGLDGRVALTERFDLGLSATARLATRARTVDYSVGPSFAVALAKGATVVAGYNFAGFHDRDYAEARYSRSGPYSTFRVKPDPNSLPR